MILTGQGTAGTAGTLLVSVPPGPSTLILTGGAIAAYYGGTGVSASNGAQLPAGVAVTIPGYASSKGTNLYAASTGSTVMYYTLSTDG